MRFAHSYVSALPADRLFEVHRDALVSFGPELVGVSTVQKLEVAEKGSVQHLRHRWTGDRSVIPWALRLWVPSWMFVWEDRSEWDEAALTGTWRITAPYVGDMVWIEGSHRFEDLGEGCKVGISGQLHVAAAKSLGGSAVDRFIQNLFTTVLESATPIIEDHVRIGSRAA